MVVDAQVYRVYQACDAVVKQNCSRKAQSAVKNVMGPRAAKNSYKNVMKANRDAVTKAKKVTKEVRTIGADSIRCRRTG